MRWPVAVLTCLRGTAAGEQANAKRRSLVSTARYGGGVLISRVWEMPSIWTFSMENVKTILKKYGVGTDWADPFAGENSPAELTNDIEGRGNQYEMDALEFLQSFPANSVQGVLFDPPYSVEQCLRRYTPKQNGTAGRAEYWGRCKDEIARVIKPGGMAISFCWDSTGIGKKRGFEIVEIMLICHGACHNDTIVTVEEHTFEQSSFLDMED